MTRAERARENFLAGCNCAQAVLLAFADLSDADEETLSRVSMGMGAGMGRMGEVCGAVSGAAMALGLLFPEKGKGEVYALVQEHMMGFAEENGSYLCRELLAGAGVRRDPSPTPEARTAAYYKKRPCPELVACSAALLEEICAKYMRK